MSEQQTDPADARIVPTDVEPLLTPAEAKSIRERMGLSTRWLAQRWERDERLVQRWERMRVLPAPLATDLTNLRAHFAAQVQALADDPAVDPIMVPRVDPDSADGFPAAWHRAVGLAAADLTGRRLRFTEPDPAPQQEEPHG